MNSKLKMPSVEDERVLNDVVNNGSSYVMVRNKKWKVKYKRYRNIRNMSNVLLSEKEKDENIVHKCVAALRLNWWQYKLFGWFLWRWYFYVKGYTEKELYPYIEECKKKVPVEGYLACIILLTGMKDTMMMMTREEVNHFQAEQLTGQLGQLEKNEQK